MRGMPVPNPGDAPPGAPWRPLAADPRFHFALRRPHARGRPAPTGLLVAVHDSTRDVASLVQGFAPLADRHGLLLLAPHFPKNPRGDGEEDGYKRLQEGPLRYDRLLHAMIDQAAAEAGAPRACITRFWLHGYSGGGQFAHRYLWLWPERLHAVVVGAPGEVTLPDPHTAWWAGVADTAARFGRRVDVAAAARVPVKLLIGEHDTETHEIKPQPPSRLWACADLRRGSDRQDRIACLHAALQALGSTARLEVMPGVAHGSGNAAALARAAGFFERLLAQKSSAVANPK